MRRTKMKCKDEKWKNSRYGFKSIYKEILVVILQEDSWTYLCFLVQALKMWPSRLPQLWAGDVLL